MANTTNFNWETPDDTDLVKDGAAAIRTLGNSIDTSLVDLKGGTTGQILSKASNTDLDYTWITNDVGDITNVAVTAPITGGGSSGSVTIGIDDGTTAQKGAVQLEDSTSSTSTTKAATPNSVKSAYDLANAAIAKSLIDAEGDLIVGDAADAVQRLAIGSNGNVLTVDTSVDGKIKWAAPAGGGKVAQVVSTTKTSSFSTNSGTYTDVTGLSVSITPTLNTSKIMVFVDVQVVGDTGVGSAFWQLVRGSTAIAIGDTEGSRRRSTGQAYSADNNTAFSGSINYLDAPATTSATTYKVQILADGGGSAFVNRSEGFGDNTAHAVNASSITVMEILA